MKILVTGGAGFIGSAVIRYIIQNSADSVVNVDKLTYAGNLESLEEVSCNERYTFEHVDICNRADVEEVFSLHEPDVVMHLAAESHVDRSIGSPSEFIQTNIMGTYNLLEAARGYWSNMEERKQMLFKFHHISTDEVFGDLTNDVDLFTEESPYLPSSPYSATKASSDHLVRAWYRTYKLPVVITNCSNNYGPYQFPEKLIPMAIQKALAGQAIPIYGSGNQIRDWLYVDDHAEALYAVINRAEIGETYNIGGRSEKRNLEVVEAVCAALQRIVPTKGTHYRDLIKHVADRPGHDRRYAIDASKIAKELRWSARETFESGIQKTVAWYVSNQAWCERIMSKQAEGSS